MYVCMCVWSRGRWLVGWSGRSLGVWVRWVSGGLDMQSSRGARSKNFMLWDILFGDGWWDTFVSTSGHFWLGGWDTFVSP